VRKERNDVPAKIMVAVVTDASLRPFWGTTKRSSLLAVDDWRGTDRNVTAALMTVRDQW
jgi:hypothetical protein